MGTQPIIMPVLIGIVAAPKKKKNQQKMINLVFSNVTERISEKIVAKKP